MKFIAIWCVCVLLIAIVYLAGITGAKPDIVAFLKKPNEVGDFIAGITALITLPSIALMLIKSQREDRRENDLARLNSIMDIYKHLNTELDVHGHNLNYLFENTLQLSPYIQWEKWHNKDDVWGYLKVAYFSSHAKEKTCAAIKEADGRFEYVFQKLTCNIQPLMQAFKKFETILGRDVYKQCMGHQAIEIYELISEARHK